ncbi:PadR family transcriptional regulator [Labilibaculum sp. DW002]|uniref:PadR family transcriptional regulator n=1 Tax=Paralabilibaculum antarcticum TaxID=2912572 RepID=A0ABT5VY53_9BACT|nr:PadR family transcriptional regulator [Labilibaculum sp. DW002]MDE5420242.1 PadR family transcriptional regulator [Labilibaculum sp. DW002]
MNEDINLYFIAKWKSQYKKGLLEYIIILLLRSRPCYGYELISDMNQFTSLEIAEGTIYPLLNRLKKEKLVTSEWAEMDTGIPRKYYKLTDEGTAHLKVMKEYVDSLNLSITRILESV